MPAGIAKKFHYVRAGETSTCIYSALGGSNLFYSRPSPVAATGQICCMQASPPRASASKDRACCFCILTAPRPACAASPRHSLARATLCMPLRIRCSPPRSARLGLGHTSRRGVDCEANLFQFVSAETAKLSEFLLSLRYPSPGPSHHRIHVGQHRH